MCLNLLLLVCNFNSWYRNGKCVLSQGRFHIIPFFPSITFATAKLLLFSDICKKVYHFLGKMSIICKVIRKIRQLVWMKAVLVYFCHVKMR